LDIGAYEYSSGASSPCDLNSDSAVNVVDIQVIINLILGVLSGPSGTGDLNHDGSVNVVDVQALVNTVLGAAACPS
jgi:hypothetical protein